MSPENLGKAPGRYNGRAWTGLKDWQKMTPTEADVDEWRDMGAGIGLRCDDGLLAIDADTLDPELSAIITGEVEAALGPLPMRVGQAPKTLFLCRTSPTYKHSDITFAGGEIEVRTSMQFVAVGTHPKTLRP